jgi:hypothetical protein
MSLYVAATAAKQENVVDQIQTLLHHNAKCMKQFVPSVA